MNHFTNLFNVAFDASTLFVLHQVSVLVENLNLVVTDNESMLDVVKPNRIIRRLLIDRDSEIGQDLRMSLLISMD